MENFDQYKNKLPYPSISRFFECTCGSSLDSASRINFCANCGIPIRQHIEDRKTIYKTLQTEFNVETARLRQKFEADLVEDQGVDIDGSITISVEKLMNYAFSEGHSDDLENVYNIFDDIVDLSR